MSAGLIFLIAWGAFVALVLVALYVDTAYYKYNLPKVYRKVINAFTEE